MQWPSDSGFRTFYENETSMNVHDSNPTYCWQCWLTETDSYICCPTISIHEDDVFIYDNFFAVTSKYLDFIFAFLIADLNKDHLECEYWFDIVFFFLYLIEWCIFFNMLNTKYQSLCWLRPKIVTVSRSWVALVDGPTPTRIHTQSWCKCFGVLSGSMGAGWIVLSAGQVQSS